MPRNKKGRIQQWNAACQAIEVEVANMEAVRERWNAQLQILLQLQGEYRMRLDSMPPNLRNSKLADDLRAIVELDLTRLDMAQYDSEMSALKARLRDAENLPLPDAFKRKTDGSDA